jgi:outer membrane usher protein
MLALWLSPATLLAAGQRSVLLLDVVINGAPINMICSFTLFPDGAIGTTESELASMGLHIEAPPGDAAIVMLHDIPTLKYSYEERSQRIRITVDDRYRNAQTIDARSGNGSSASRPQSGIGAVLNYDLFGSYGEVKEKHEAVFSTLAATLEGRAFAPIGTFSQTAVARLGEAGEPPLTRLDTSYRFSDPDTLLSVTAGDTITGGLWWSRPIRIGGLQAQTSFSLRPDLVTLALPNLGGTAAVPSTIDVYVNSIHTYSQDIGTGPFNLTNIPTVTGAGNAEVVLRDSAGRSTTTSVPFYGTTLLLAPGRSSWSAEIGLPRLSYGSAEDHYDTVPVGAGTWRRGMLPWLTAEAHAEAGAGIESMGLGAAFRIRNFGVASIDGAGSNGNGKPGAQANANFETALAGVNISLSTQRAFGNYQDLASATAERQAQADADNDSLLGGAVSIPLTSRTGQNQLIYASARVPRAIDRVTFGGKIPFDKKAGWSLSLVHQHDTAGIVSSIVSASYSRTLAWNMSAFATAYHDFGSERTTGGLFGISIPFGPSTSVSANLASGAGGLTGSLAASRSLGSEPGSFGWQAEDTEGVTAYRSAAVSYRSAVATVQADANQSKTSLGGNIEVSGAVATMASDVFFSNRINDAFAVVDAGAPGVAVAYENRPVGTTDSQGKLLVPGLRSYQKNRISIDPSNLPVDAEVANTRRTVTPADRAGVLVTMKHHKNLMAAVVTFVRPDGAFVPAGAWGRHEGGGEFIVGYDGQSFIKDLASINHVSIESNGTACRVSFPFKPVPGKQVKIGPLTCR